MSRPIKLLLVGNSGVGKSSLLLRFTSDRFDDDIATTIGIDFKVKMVPIGGGEQVQVQLWDTAGQERFRTLTSSYYRGANAVALVYDVNDVSSFEALNNWLSEVRAFCPEDAVLLLIGTKTDVSRAPAVDRERAIAFAKANGALFALCSAKTREGVVEAFEELARKVHDKRLESTKGDDHEGISLKDRSNSSSSRGVGKCC